MDSLADKVMENPRVPLTGRASVPEAAAPLARAKAPFHVLVKPAGPLCNLDCAYCFYLKKTEYYPGTKRFAMDEATLERLTRQYLEQQPVEIREVNFAWQGGEPTLMGLDFFRRAIALQRQYRPAGVTITNALQTNGTRLNDDWARFLHDEGFLVGISVDGPEDLHNHYRKDKGGQGSFAQVMRGLDLLRRHQVEFNTLTVVQNHNGEHPERVYRFLKESGSTFLQFIPIVEPSGPGQLSERSVGSRQFGRFLNGIFELWRQRDVGQVYVQHFDMMLGLVMGLPSSLCVHAEVCGRNVAMEHNGDVFSCDHFVFPEYKLGNVAERTLGELLDQPVQDKFGLDKRDGLPGDCRRCPYLKLCHGGCPAHRLRRDSQGEPGMNVLCDGYQAFYQHSLPVFQAMAQCLRRQLPASAYGRFMADPRMPAGQPAARVGRNDPCPCGSGKKAKHCCQK